MTAPDAPTYRLKVLRATAETPTAVTLRLGFPDGVPFEFRPGQFMLFSLPGAAGTPGAQRAFSLASSPLEPGGVEITVGPGGEPSRGLLGLREGDLVDARGPYGRFTLDERAPASVFIFGGTGASPLRAMIRHALAKALPMRLSALGSFRTPADVLYRSEWAEHAARGVRVHLTVTRVEAAAEAPWVGARGRLSAATVAGVAPDWREAVHYLCGPAKMVAELAEDLAASGVPREHIRRERWGEF